MPQARYVLQVFRLLQVFRTCPAWHAVVRRGHCLGFSCFKSHRNRCQLVRCQHSAYVSRRILGKPTCLACGCLCWYVQHGAFSADIIWICFGVAVLRCLCCLMFRRKRPPNSKPLDGISLCTSSKAPFFFLPKPNTEGEKERRRQVLRQQPPFIERQRRRRQTSDGSFETRPSALRSRNKCHASSNRCLTSSNKEAIRSL